VHLSELGEGYGGGVGVGGGGGGEGCQLGVGWWK
jgi:hypothetical protein